MTTSETAPPSRLTPQQETYCLARAAGKNGKEAAEIAGIAERTSWDWNADPAIQARIDELQQPVKDAVLRHFRAHALRAAERVTQCMEPGRAGATGDLNLKAALATLRFVGAEPASKTDLTVLTSTKVYLVDAAGETPMDEV